MHFSANRQRHIYFVQQHDTVSGLQFLVLLLDLLLFKNLIVQPVFVGKAIKFVSVRQSET